MILTTSPATAPLRFPLDLRLTPEQFELVCAENREAVLELDADGRLIALTPTGSETGSRNGELFSNGLGGWKAGPTESLVNPFPASGSRSSRASC